MTTQELKQLEVLFDKKFNGFATKDDLINLATKDDLINLATKDDLEKVKVYLEGEIGQIGSDILEVVSHGTPSKIDFISLQKRVENAERTLLHIT